MKNKRVDNDYFPSGLSARALIVGIVLLLIAVIFCLLIYAPAFADGDASDDKLYLPLVQKKENPEQVYRFFCQH